MWIPILFISVTAAVAVVYTLSPLFARGADPALRREEELAEMLTRKDATLRAIRDLEFDHSVGKIENDDFARFNRMLRQKAMTLLQEIDRYAPPASALDGALEEEISRLRRLEDRLPDEGGRGIRDEQNSDR